jgi:hypothetical protein
MAYDEELADRIRELHGDETGWEEKAMFGGLAFLVAGHLAVSVSGQGGLLVRSDPSKAEALIASSAATQAVMGGREMRGWVRVAAEDVRTKRQLTRWVRLGGDYARSVPPKAKGRRTR